MTDPYRTLIPAPRHAAASAGSFRLDSGTGLHVAVGPSNETDLAQLVRRSLAPLGLRLEASAGPRGAVSVRTSDADGGAVPGGYTIAVREDGVEIVGAGPDGVRNALQTLRQLLGPDAWRAAPIPGRALELPCGTVSDAPAVSWRGGMLDVARHFLPKRVVLKYVDLLAMHRMNRLHLHLTDDQGWRVESRRHPEINRLSTHRDQTLVGYLHADGDYDGTPHGGYYTLDDLAEISAYAAERGIVLVPEIDIPGHASALMAALPDVGTGTAGVRSRWGVASGVLKPVPRVVALVTELIDEVLGAVDTPYVHLGGDECVTAGWADDPEVVAHMRTLGIAGPGRLHGWFLREVADRLAERGKRAVVWDEAFQNGGIRQDTIVMCWRGDALARAAAAAGHDIVRSPVFPTYLDYAQSAQESEPLSIGGPTTLANCASFEVSPPDWTAEERDRVLGGQFHAWTEYIPDERHLDYMLFPRACAIADALWAGHAVDAADLERRLGAAHLARLAAAGCEYRPLEGPLPWQRGGRGRRAPSAESERWSETRWRAWSAELPASGEARPSERAPQHRADSAVHH
ncbi:beta-N-acetylhexosaminidase [Actinacidiphila alni]|uniref:beta-N-acetylhexosaminidase n=1 Tax=Actinacidiphila alni TaxID=380248 RepID=UPI0034512EF0